MSINRWGKDSSIRLFVVKPGVFTKSGRLISPGRRITGSWGGEGAGRYLCLSPVGEGQRTNVSY